ncbi:hypothetical protein FAGKG844_10173 [Frankia sp. AgKG'84/4]
MNTPEFRLRGPTVARARDAMAVDSAMAARAPVAPLLVDPSGGRLSAAAAGRVPLADRVAAQLREAPGGVKVVNGGGATVQVAPATDRSRACHGGGCSAAPGCCRAPTRVRALGQGAVRGALRALSSIAGRGFLRAGDVAARRA